MTKPFGSILALAFAALLALTGQPATAQLASPPEAPKPTVPELVQAAYRWGDFAELERLYAVYGKPGLRSELTGHARLEHFWMGIGKVNDSGLNVTDDYFQQLDELTQRWARDNPRSVLAQLLYAESLRTHAWVYRGNGFANTVSEAAWAEFHKYLELALAQLRRTEALAANDSSWNAIMLDTGRGLDWDKDKLFKVFQAGIAKNPDHDGLYFKMQTVLLPKWGGDLESVDRLIALAVKNTREARGMEMYARLYASLSYGEVNQRLFDTTRASWPSMKAGFEDRLRRYPHVDHRNMYAYFACMAHDLPVLQEQLELIGDRFEANFWGSNPEVNYEACKKLARKV